MSAAAAAAAAAARRRREEEETMPGYTASDLEQYEFKILRSATSAFRKPEELSRALEEESRAGWTLVEKFDNQRLRLKRPIAARAQDAGLGFDPYRTTFGMSEGRLAMVIVSTVVGVIAVVIAIVATIASSRPSP
jgi:hypothetical protein